MTSKPPIQSAQIIMVLSCAELFCYRAMVRNSSTLKADKYAVLLMNECVVHIDLPCMEVHVYQELLLIGLFFCFSLCPFFILLDVYSCSSFCYSWLIDPSECCSGWIYLFWC